MKQTIISVLENILTAGIVTQEELAEFASGKIAIYQSSLSDLISSGTEPEGEQTTEEPRTVTTRRVRRSASLPSVAQQKAEGEQIRKIRTSLEMTQVQLADATDLHQSIISELERGAHKSTKRALHLATVMANLHHAQTEAKKRAKKAA